MAGTPRPRWRRRLGLAFRDLRSAEVPLRLRVYVGGAVLVAIAAASAAAALAEDRAFEQPWLLGVFAALVALQNILSVRLRKGEEGESRAQEEALLAFMLLLVSPLAALAAFTAGAVVGQLAAPRGALKVVFNIAQFVAAAALAVTLVTVLAPGDEFGPARVLAILVGILAFSALNRAAVAGVLATAGAGAFWDGLRQDLRPASIVWVGAVSVGLLAGLVAIADPWALPFALAASGALSVALSGDARARRDRAALGELVDSSAAAIFSVDDRGRISAWNPEMERVTGRPADEADGAYLADVLRIRNEDGSGVDNLLSAPSRAEPRERRLVRLASASGGERWLTLSRAGLPDGGFAFVALDVTERKRAESLAELQTRALERIAAGAPLPDVLELLVRLVEEHSDEEVLASVLVLDEDGLHLRHGAAPSLPAAYNAAVDRVAIGPSVGFCGTAAFRGETVVVADIASDPLWDIPRELALRHGLRACWSTPIIPAGGNVLGTFAMYYREPRAPSPADLELAAVATHLAGVAIERAGQEERLRSAETRYRSLVEHLPLTTYIDTIDATSSNIYSSPQIEPLLGHSVEEWRSNPNLFPEILHPDDRERVLAEHAHTHETGEPLCTEYRAIARDGRVVWIQDEAIIVKDERGNPRYLQGYLLDVTARKTLESDLLQAQKMDAVGQLAGGVAHDFNNMMSAVVGFSELALARLEQGDPVRGHVGEIRRAGERASEMTHQLLAFSRKQMLQPRVLDLNSIVAEAERLLRRLIGEHIDLVSVLATELEQVEADPGQLDQVLMNLAVNARDAMPSGGKLTIETANVDLSEDYAASHVEVVAGSHVMLAVTDTGVGMNPETRARIFEPFFTTKEQGKGTGLGLATVFGIVKQSGGHISVYSEPGRGTTFKIYLPRAQANHSASESREAAEAAPRGQETVLLVEDEELVRNLAREALEAQGYTVLEAHDGSNALERSGNHEGPIHLLLTDVVMPGISGRELADTLAPERPEMKVLYASGYADEAIVRHGVLEPGIAFLPKPVTPSSLARKVREVLDATTAQTV